MNNMIFAFELVFTFGALVIMERLFHKGGLYAWVAVATILANIATAKSVVLFGMTATLGTVMFASVFLATDILTEFYSKEEARQAVKLALFVNVLFIAVMQIALAYIPSASDYANDAMTTLFALNMRICAASAVMFFIANMADVYLYSLLKEKTRGRHLWLRNNLSTIACNCLENFAFIFLAFVGIYDTRTLLIIALSTSAVEVVASVCDTPFLYIVRAEKQGKWQDHEKT